MDKKIPKKKGGELVEGVRHVKKEIMMKRRDGPQPEGDGKVVPRLVKVLVCLHIMLEYGHSGQLG